MAIKTACMMNTAANQAEAFYATALEYLVRSQVPFMIGGAYALRDYAGIFRETKDLDVFCAPEHYLRILNILATAGFMTEVTSPIWLAKAFQGEYYVDIIFSSANGLCRVDDLWFRHARLANLFGFSVKLIPPEEMIWSKAYVQNRHRFDGADIAHIVIQQGPTLDWRRLLARMGPDWEVLFAHLVNFRFVYPSERDTVPEWLLRELCSRVEEQLAGPAARGYACRGRLLTAYDYEIDMTEWGYQDASFPS